MHQQDDFYAKPLLLSWENLGGEMAIQFDGPRGIWIARFEDGVELRADARTVRFVEQEPRSYFRHERFLRQLTPAVCS